MMAAPQSPAQRRKLKIRSGDQVKVIGRQGSRQERQGAARGADASERVYVEGLNMVKRHMRPSRCAGTQRGQTVGGVIEREGPIHVSNVMLLDPKDGKPTRVRHRARERQAACASPSARARESTELMQTMTQTTPQPA